MRAFVTPAERARRRRQISLAASLALHGLLLSLLELWPVAEPEPPERLLELSFVRAGERSEEGGERPAQEAAPEPAPAPAPPTPAPPSPRPPSPLLPQPDRFPALAHARDARPLHAPPVPSPPAPRSFRDWQRSRASSFVPAAPVLGGGEPDGTDAVSTRGRDRCEPAPDRRPAVVYLLFDSSGSMSSALEAQALSCAHQYAQAAIAGGGEVVVGNFALGVRFSKPTRDMLDVETALRDVSDRRATILPARELQPFWDQATGAADLVIVSDGWFDNTRDVLLWYRYFLEANRDNRGVMYTVGTPGRREAVGQLRSIGFDVFMYEQIGRR